MKTKKTKIISICLAIMFLFGIFSVPVSAASYCESRATYNFLTVTAPSGLNVRWDPNTSSRILGAIPLGVVVHVKEYRGNWAKIDTGIYDGRWICTDYTTKTWFRRGSGQVKTNSGCGLTLRKGPSTSFSAITVIPYGTIVSKSYYTSSWCYVSYQLAGRVYSGWVSSTYVK